MADLGFAIDRLGKNGTFELAAIDDKAISFFSARRREIESELFNAGTTSASSAALAASIAKSTINPPCQGTGWPSRNHLGRSGASCRSRRQHSGRHWRENSPRV